MQDPVIARWNVPDPMAEAFENVSPYAYVENNPVLFLDPTGMYRVDANGNITIDDPDEISKFLHFLNSTQNITTEAMVNHVISADQGFSWELDAVSVTGKSAFASGGWLGDAQNRVSNAVGQMGNINTIGTPHLRFEQPSGGMGGMIGSGVGAVLSVGSHLMYNKESWYSLRQMKSYSHRFHGNQHTGGRLAHGRTFSRGFTGAGYGLGIYNAYSVEQQYSRGHLSGTQRWVEQGSNVISTFGGIHGAAWGIGWEIGRTITNIPGYHENVRVPVRRILGINR